MRKFTVTESGVNCWKTRDRKAQNLLLSPMQNIGANPGVIRQSGMHKLAFNEGGTTEAALFVLISRTKRAFFHV